MEITVCTVSNVELKMDKHQINDDPTAPAHSTAYAETGGVPAIYAYAAGDFKAGMLLWRLAHLCRKSKLMHGGVRWYVRSREDLMIDLGWSKHRYDRAIRILRDLELIDTSNAAKLHYPSASLQTTAFSITQKGHEAIAKGRATVLNAYKKGKQWS